MIDLENVAEIEVEIQEAGPQGEKGERGPSAYEVYLEAGGTLSEVEWLESLKGEAGKDGYTPERGTDYWTQEDITAIKSYCNSYIDSQLGTINEQLASLTEVK